MQSFAPKFWCKFSLLLCSALLGPSPTISRQESKSCRTEDRVSGSSPQPSTFQEKYIHTIRQCISELDLISDQLHFKILLLGITHWCREIDHVFIHPYHSEQYLSVTTNSNADFCLNYKKVRTTKLKMATVWPSFTTASRTRELNLASLQMHVGGSVTVYINIIINFNILVTLQMMGQSGSVPLEFKRREWEKGRA